MTQYDPLVYKPCAVTIFMWVSVKNSVTIGGPAMTLRENTRENVFGLVCAANQCNVDLAHTNGGRYDRKSGKALAR